MVLTTFDCKVDMQTNFASRKGPEGCRPQRHTLHQLVKMVCTTRNLSNAEPQGALCELKPGYMRPKGCSPGIA
jgi:hypothetical protein